MQTTTPRFDQSARPARRLLGVALLAVATLLLAAPAFGQCVAPPSLLYAWWPMSPTNVWTTDEVIAENDAILNNGPVPVSGLVGDAMSFDGVNEYLSVPDCDYFDLGTGDFTLLAWVRTNAATGSVLAKRTRSGANYRGYLLQVNGGRPLLQMADPANNWQNFPGSSLPRVDDGAWHLVAASVDRDSTTGGRLHVDAGAPHVFNPTGRQGDLSTTSELRIGRSAAEAPFQISQLYFDGEIDEVMVVRRAMSTAEIQAIFNAGADGLCRRLAPALQLCHGPSDQ
ncbi:MAG: LamG domain-containing protein [Acidobacteriota bacterium]